MVEASSRRAALKKRDPLQRGIVTVLNGAPGRAFSLPELAEEVHAAPGEVREAITYLNRIAEAFGYLPLINDTTQEVSIDPETGTVVRYALEELKRMGS
ncbi:hypothetical protein [Nonomuraea sp. JJY05]|jgi:hypothetical protein|uniref:hypothetical protein n=1 Tax=Nonomuraea sp. JJY05 TaxID=3350255 RepID=UPI00373E2608